MYQRPPTSPGSAELCPYEAITNLLRGTFTSPCSYESVRDVNDDIAGVQGKRAPHPGPTYGCRRGLELLARRGTLEFFPREILGIMELDAHWIPQSRVPRREALPEKEAVNFNEGTLVSGSTWGATQRNVYMQQSSGNWDADGSSGCYSSR